MKRFCQLCRFQRRGPFQGSILTKGYSRKQAPMETYLKPLSQAFSHVANVPGQFEVGGTPLKPGGWLDLSVFGHWIAGQVKVDPGG